VTIPPCYVLAKPQRRKEMLEKIDEAENYLHARGFANIALDIEGCRMGSMNESLRDGRDGQE